MVSPDSQARGSNASVNSGATTLSAVPCTTRMGAPDLCRPGSFSSSAFAIAGSSVSSPAKNGPFNLVDSLKTPVMQVLSAAAMSALPSSVKPSSEA